MLWRDVPAVCNRRFFFDEVPTGTPEITYEGRCRNMGRPFTAGSPL